MEAVNTNSENSEIVILACGCHLFQKNIAEGAGLVQPGEGCEETPLQSSSV